MSGAPPVVTPAHTTYTAFVEDGSDLVGLIAYALYKGEKIAFSDRHVTQFGTPPSTQEMAIFIQVFNMPAQIQAYRGRAEELLEAMNEDLLGQVVETLKSEKAADVEAIEAKHQADLLRGLKEARGFWKGVRENVAANLFAAALTIILVVLVYGSQISIVPTLGRALGYEVTEIDRSPSSKLSSDSSVVPAN